MMTKYVMAAFASVLVSGCAIKDMGPVCRDDLTSVAKDVHVKYTENTNRSIYVFKVNGNVALCPTSLPKGRVNPPGPNTALSKEQIQSLIVLNPEQLAELQSTCRKILAAGGTSGGDLNHIISFSMVADNEYPEPDQKAKDDEVVPRPSKQVVFALQYTWERDRKGRPVTGRISYRLNSSKFEAMKPEELTKFLADIGG